MFEIKGKTSSTSLESSNHTGENTTEAISLQGTTIACKQSQTIEGRRRGKKEGWQVSDKLKK